MNELYRGMVVANIVKAMKSAETAQCYKHNGLKGRAREIFVSNLLEPYLYPTMGVSTGVVIDSFNRQSNQVDVIIYDKQIVPPILLTPSEGIIPFESVLATIEVKSKLTKNELRKGFKNCISVKELDPNPSCFPVDCNLNRLNEIFKDPYTGIFAFNTDLKDDVKKEKIRFNEVKDEINWQSENQPVIALCIANKICCNWGKCEGELDDHWIYTTHTDQFDEIMNFIMGVVNTCRTISITRGKAYFGTYVI